MTSAQKTHAAIAASGITLIATPGRGLKATPASGLTDEIRQIIRANKEALIDYLLAANDETADPDRDCWPHSDAMNGAEIDLLQTRIAIFTRRGVRPAEAEALADSMVKRDREGDDRRTCLECSKLLRGMQCSASETAGFGRHVAALVRMPQRCHGFGGAS